MSKLFEACPNDISSTLDATVAPVGEATVEGEKYPIFSRKQWKIIKKVRKLLKKQNKMLKKINKKETIQRGMEEKSTEKAENKETRGFFRQFGKAICKAVPTVLTTLAIRAFNFIFMGKGTRAKSGLQFAGSWR